MPSVWMAILVLLVLMASKQLALLTKKLSFISKIVFKRLKQLSLAQFPIFCHNS